MHWQVLEGMFFIVVKLKCYCQCVYNTLSKSTLSDFENQITLGFQLYHQNSDHNYVISRKMSLKLTLNVCRTNLKFSSTIARD